MTRGITRQVSRSGQANAPDASHNRVMTGIDPAHNRVMTGIDPALSVKSAARPQVWPLPADVSGGAAGDPEEFGV